MRKWMIAVAVTAGMMMPGAALAAYVTTDLNMRAGPGTHYHRIGVIPARHQVHIYTCLRNTSWCEVAYGGVRGWASSRYIASGGGGYRVYRQPRVYVAPSIGIYVGPRYHRRHYGYRHYYGHRRYYGHRYHHRRHYGYGNRWYGGGRFYWDK